MTYEYKKEARSYRKVLKVIAEMDPEILALDVTVPIDFAKQVLAEYDQDNRVTPANPWITDRKPTEEDCFNKRIFIFAPLLGTKVRTCWLIEWNGEPWQPAPECLRVEPEQQRCEDCQHGYIHKTFNPRSESEVDEEDVVACFWVKTFNSHYGMDGCNFQRKQSTEC